RGGRRRAGRNVCRPRGRPLGPDDRSARMALGDPGESRQRGGRPGRRSGRPRLAGRRARLVVAGAPESISASSRPTLAGVQICPNCGEENPAKFRLCGFCGTPLAPASPPQEVRKLVTILFCDLKGSTSLGETLDSESLRETMSRYFDAMSASITRHGGTIEKFIGDAVMAVFGLPRVHEDDALRAVRAARGMQEALADLNDGLERSFGVTLANRIGVDTGEV